MKLAYSTNAYTRFSITETIRRIAAIGYSGIELMADEPHAWPEDLTPRDIDAIRHTLDEHGLALQHQRLHDDQDQRPTAALLASVVDRAGSDLSPSAD